MSIRSRGVMTARVTWLLSILAFALYQSTFASLGGTLGARADVIADADTGPFTRLISEWSVSRRYGDAWNRVQRSDLDRTQEHKIKHVLVGALFGPLATAGTAAGLSPFAAAKLAGAVSAALNVAMVGLILGLAGVHGSVSLPLLVLLAIAPGQWVFAALPESWPLSGTFVLLAVLLSLRWPARPGVLGVVVGVGMLNNVVLALLALLPLNDGLLRGESAPRAIRDAVIGGLVALGVWAGCLALLAYWDPDLRPDRVVSFIRFFSDLLSSSEDPLSPKALFRSMTQLGVSGFASNQPDPVFGTIITNGKHSQVGMWGMLGMAGLYVVAAGGAVHACRDVDRLRLRVLGAACTALGALWSLLHLRFHVFIWFYSPALLPPLVIILAVLLEHVRRQHVARVWLLWLVVAVVAVCGASQIRLLASLAKAGA